MKFFAQLGRVNLVVQIIVGLLVGILIASISPEAGKSVFIKGQGGGML